MEMWANFLVFLIFLLLIHIMMTIIVFDCRIVGKFNGMNKEYHISYTIQLLLFLSRNPLLMIHVKSEFTFDIWHLSMFYFPSFSIFSLCCSLKHTSLFWFWFWVFALVENKYNFALLLVHKVPSSKMNIELKVRRSFYCLLTPLNQKNKM